MKIPSFVMRSARPIFMAWAALVCPSQFSAGADTHSAILWAGATCEISLGKVSDRTAQLVVAPLDDQGQPRPVPPTAAFVSFPVTEEFRSRDIAGVENVQVGKLRFTIKEMCIRDRERTCNGMDSSCAPGFADFNRRIFCF